MSYFTLHLLNTTVGWTETVFGHYCVIQFAVELGSDQKNEQGARYAFNYFDCLKFLLPGGGVKETLIRKDSVDIRKHLHTPASEI